MTFLDVARKLEAASSGSYPADILGPQDPPTLTSLAPSSIVAGAPTLVTITGTGFNHNATVVVDGVAQGTTWIDATHVRYRAEATAPPSQDVAVRNGPSADSNVLVLTVTASELTRAGEEELGPDGTEQSGSPPAEPAVEPEPAPAPEEPPPTPAAGNGGGSGGAPTRSKRQPRNGG